MKRVSLGLALARSSSSDHHAAPRQRQAASEVASPVRREPNPALAELIDKARIDITIRGFRVRAYGLAALLIGPSILFLL